jgi:hypothetical protein
MAKGRDYTLLALSLIVGTNAVGYSLILTENHVAQLILAAIVPGLTILLVYLKLAPGARQAAEKLTAVKRSEGYGLQPVHK